MEPLALFGVATAVGKLLVKAYELRQDPSLAGGVEVSEATEKTWEKLRGVLSGAAKDPVTAQIATRLQAQLYANGIPEAHRDACQAAADNVAVLLGRLAGRPDAVLQAGRDPDGFPQWALEHGGSALLAGTSESAERFFNATLKAATEEFSRLAPFSPRFVPAAVTRILDGVDRLQESISTIPSETVAQLRESGLVGVSTRQVGHVRTAASAFQARDGMRTRIETARTTAGPGAVVVLKGPGGRGKSQLAAWYAREAVASGTDLVVWADGRSEAGLLAAFAGAAAAVQGRPPGQTASQVGDEEQLLEADARWFVDWAAGSSRSWLVVLDDVDPAVIGSWWPASHTGTGWVLATTRSNDPRLTGGGRRIVEVGLFEADEAKDYLADRLSEGGRPHLLDPVQAAALAERLGYLPLALSHAAAYMLAERVGCGEYLDRYTSGAARLDELMPGDPDSDTTVAIATTLLLALDAAEASKPVGLARPALELASVFDAAGHPVAVWQTTAVANYLTIHRIAPPAHEGDWVEVSATQARQAMMLLDRYGLIDFVDTAQPPVVAMHSVTGDAVRETTPAADLADVVWAAADALLDLWPFPDALDSVLTGLLRANTEALMTHSVNGDLLWGTSDGGHPVLWCHGDSLNRAGLIRRAVDWWGHTSETAFRLLGPDHPDTLSSRNNLAYAYELAGQLEKAISLHEQNLADSVRVLGPDDPQTLTSRNNLATTYQFAGQSEKAISLHEQNLAVSGRVLGPDHPDTLSSRNNLASTYQFAGQLEKATSLHEETLADCVRVLGPDHPQTLSSRNNLASTYMSAGQLEKAISLYEQILADCVRVLGPDDPQTLTSRNNLAYAYESAGQLEKAISLYEQILADCVRVLGPDHPQTLSTRNNLAYAYQSAGQMEKAISLFERTLADRVPALGPDHPDTLASRNNLASAYMSAGQLEKATRLHEQILADCVRVLGPDHPQTLTSRNNLSGAYHLAGQSEKAISLFEQTLADRERVLGPDHPATLTSRNNLAHAYESAAQTEKATPLREQG
jgi:tetratricopeptide (TPR) repeat protein